MNFFKILLFLCLPLFASAQMMDVRQTLVEHDEQERFALAVNFEADPKPVKKAWSDFIKSELDLKLDGFGFLTNKDLLSAQAVRVPQLSDKQLNFYTLFAEEDDITIMNVFVSYGYDIYLNRRDYPEDYAVLRDLVNRFVYGYVPAYYEEKVEMTAEMVDDIKDEIEDLNKDMDKNKETIEENQEEIEELKNENSSLVESLAETREKLQQKQALLARQQQKLENVKEEINNK